MPTSKDGDDDDDDGGKDNLLLEDLVIYDEDSHDCVSHF
jgi:hypothetical protein